MIYDNPEKVRQIIWMFLLIFQLFARGCYEAVKVNSSRFTDEGSSIRKLTVKHIFKKHTNENDLNKGFYQWTISECRNKEQRMEVVEASGCNDYESSWPQFRWESFRQPKVSTECTWVSATDVAPLCPALDQMTAPQFPVTDNQQ